MKQIRIFGVVLALVFTAGALVASGSEETAKKVESSGEAESSSKAETFAVGDDVALGDWQVKVHAVTDPVQVAADSFTPVEAGKRRVGIDAEVTNNSDEPAAVSSLLCFELKDSENKTYDQALVADGDTGTIDGEIAPGAALRGEIFYDVPEAATGLVVNFKCDLFASGSATIALS